MPGTQRPARMRLSALRDQHAVVGIERHHIGDRAERDQIEQLRRPAATAGSRLLASRRCSAAMT